MDIVTETINRIRLSDNEIIILHSILKKMDSTILNAEEKKLYKIMIGRLEGRIKLKKENLTL